MNFMKYHISLRLHVEFIDDRAWLNAYMTKMKWKIIKMCPDSNAGSKGLFP